MHPQSDPASAAELERLLAQSEWLRRLARALVADPHAADDVVQDAWVAALERRRALRVDLGAWMRGAVRHLARRRRRRDADRPAIERRAARDEHADPRAPIERMELQRWLADALLALDEPYRSAVILRHVEGLDIGAIAVRQSCSRDAARQRVARGLARLRERLDDRCGGHALAGLALAPLVPRDVAAAGELVIGGWIMGTKSVVAACALLVAGAAAWLWLRDDGLSSPAEPRHPSELAAAPSAALDGDAASVPDAPGPSARDAVLTAEPASAAAAAPRNPLVALLRGRVVDARRMPIAGAAVDVLRPEAGHFSVLDVELNRAPRVVAGATTGADGTFEFALERGVPLDVAVAASGYCEAKLPGRCAGEELEVVLDRGCRVRGRVTRALDGSAIEGAEVRVFGYGRRSGERATHTDAEGFYELVFGDLGDARLEVSSARHVGSAWLQFALDERREARVDVALDDGIAVIGVVSDAASGEPIADAEVGEGWMFHKSARTDAQGRYRLEGFGVNGYHELYARAPQHATAQRTELPPAVAGVMRADFELARGRRAHGRVVDASGAPLAGAYVGAVASEQGPQGQDVDWISARADAAGRFEFVRLDPGLRHCALVAAEGLATKVYDFPADEFARSDVDLGDLALDPPALLAGRVLDDTGAPVAGADVFLRGANADRGRLRGDAKLPEAGDFYVGARTTTSDAQGAFAFGALGAGAYQLRARRAGQPDSERVAIELARAEVREDVVVRYPRGEELAGRVVDALGRPVAGMWLDLRLEHRRSDGGRRPSLGGVGAVSRPDGSFSFAGLEPGTYTLDVFALEASDDPDAPWLSAQYAGLASGRPARDFAIERGVCIRGRVVDAAGAALVGYSVAAEPPAGVEREPGIRPGSSTDERGEFALAVRPARLWRVEVYGTPQSGGPPQLLAVQGDVASGTRGLLLRVSAAQR